MRGSFKNIVMFAFVLLLFPKQGIGQLLSFGGKNFFLNGANICWKNYGWDFGDNTAGYNGGNGYDAAWWESTFASVESYKGNSVRIWVHCKGEHNPIFNVSGKCTGVNNNFYNNLDDLLQRAENHNLMVILCLYDFHMVDASRQDIVKDTSKTNAYIKNALIPMVKRYTNQCNLVAWEVINEPEWIMSGISGGGNYGSGGISISQMQRFVGMCASAIHANSSKMVTVGSASLKWNSAITPAVGNYWSNASLKAAAYNDDKAYLDFYQIHYYDWMAPSFSPYSTTKGNWGLDKPVLVGETGNEGHFNYQQQFDYSYSNGFMGCMPWAYESGGAATWNEFNSEMLSFRNAHVSVVDFDCALLLDTEAKRNVHDIVIKQEGNTLVINGMTNSSRIRMIDLLGREYYDDRIEKNEEEYRLKTTLNPGLYVIMIESQNGFFGKNILVF